MEKSEKLKTLIIDGTKYRTTIPEGYQNLPKYKYPDDTVINSIIPGTINKIFVKEGQKVKKNSRLLILEAMKMKNRILCPFYAVVKKINVKQGQNVPKDAVLIKLERIKSGK